MSAVRPKTEHCSAGVLCGTTSSEAQCFWAKCAMCVSPLILLVESLAYFAHFLRQVFTSNNNP